MTHVKPYTDLTDDQLREVDVHCETFEAALLTDAPVSIEEHIRHVAADLQGPLFRELLAAELESRLAKENPPPVEEYLIRFPDRSDDIRSIFLDAHRANVGSLTSGIRDPHLEAIGSVIGLYKLRELIGEGGMGLVYAAEQEQPVRRTVALKIIKPGMDTKEVMARFEAERQALALMDHPNIAHVMDARATESGRPYFVMELIRGVPITEYCDTHGLTTEERLALFVQVCHAVQHAHQKGIIHRDLKPSNILVTLRDQVPVPKVIDFGVAKAINQRLTERTIYTSMSHLVGTPMYMSPEQAERTGLDVDTRTDIYSLGVVLYELLTGTTPFTKERLSQVGYDEMRRIIREQDPPSPSQRLSTMDTNTQSIVADQRRANTLKLSQQLQGELDWIVMKAMDKDLTRRYETASELAADVQRYLADKPVLACPPSKSYLFRKFMRRHRLALAVATLLIVGLLMGITGLAVSNVLITKQKHTAELAQAQEKAQRLEAERQRMEAEKQRSRADENFQRARQVVDQYFTLVSENTLLQEPGLQPLRKDLLASAVAFYESQAEEYHEDPEVLVKVANTRLRLAATHYHLNNLIDMLREFEASFALIEDVLTLAPVDATEFESLPGFWRGYRNFEVSSIPGGSRNASDQHREQVLWNQAISLWRSFVAAHPDIASFRRELAFFLTVKACNHELFGTEEEEQEALAEARQILEHLVQQYPENRELLAELASMYMTQGLKTTDLAMMRDGIAMMERADVPSFRFRLGVLVHELGWKLLESGRSSEAVEPFQRCIDIFGDMAEEFPHIERYDMMARWWMSDLAKALAKSGREPEAEQLATSISPRTGSDFVLKGNIYRSILQHDKAIENYDMALKVGLRGPIPDVGRVGNFLDAQKQHQKAIDFYTHGIITTHEERVSRIYADRGASWARLRQYDKSLADFTSSIEINSWQCEHHLSRMRPAMLRDSPKEFQAAFLKLADRAIEITGGSGESYITRSLVYLALGDREQAKADLGRGVKLDPHFEVRWLQRPLLEEVQREAAFQP